MLQDIASGTRARRSNWILWWRVDPYEINRQVRGYRNLGRKSARVAAALCLAFSILTTAALIAATVTAPSAVIDATLMAVLAIFVFLGHRWAMIGAMVLWTIEKASLVATALATNPVSLPAQLIWWCLYMHFFYAAFRVEQERRRPAFPQADVFD